MFQLYAEDLGLEDIDFYAKHVDSSELTIRWNYYPACPQPSTVLGAKSHTDANLITFLLQDSVGGLQVEKDGCWFDVKPIEGALVINISDGFHVSHSQSETVFLPLEFYELIYSYIESGSLAITIAIATIASAVR